MVRLEVSWRIRTNPVVIGQNLELFCNTTKIDCSDCASQWRLDNRLLTFYDRAVNPEKFDVVHAHDGFTLIIKNLSYDHIHRNYECSYNFHRHTQNLTLPHNYEHHPAPDTVNSTHTADEISLQVNILFAAVRPVPVCYAYLNGKNLSSAMETYIVSKERFYEATVTLNHTFVDDTCNGKLLVHCLTGGKNETYIDTFLDLGCEDVTTTASSLSTAIIVAVALSVILLIVTLIVIVLLCIYRRRKKSTKKTKSNIFTNAERTCLNIRNEDIKDLPKDACLL